MRIDNLNELPDWDDSGFDDENEASEDWKTNPTRNLCKAMYVQWNHVITVLKAALESMQEPGEENAFGKDDIDEMKAMILADGYEVAAKIRSSEAGLYIIRMENAAIIRKNAQFIKISTNGFVMDELMDEEHRMFIREEIDKFRELFIQWVASFKKDEYVDDWGLFL